jgi:DNA-binding CsgD family transcriptional regulator
VSSRLRTKDCKAILDIVRIVNEDDNEPKLSQHVLTRLGALVGCDSVSYCHVGLDTGSLLSATHAPCNVDIGHLPGFHTMLHQHPGFSAYRCGQVTLGTPVALTDLVDLQTLRRLPLYADYLQFRGINEQLLCLIHESGHKGAVLSFNRARQGISQRDRAVVSLVVPHLRQALTRHQRLASLSVTLRRFGRHAAQIDNAGPRLALLTAREREVVEHLVGGITDRQIARALNISPRTVHKHLESIYRKLDIDNRTSLVTLIHQQTTRV